MNNIKPASGGLACGLLLVSPNMFSATLFCMIITSGSIVIVFTGPKSFWKCIRRNKTVTCGRFCARKQTKYHSICPLSFNVFSFLSTDLKWKKYLTYLDCNRHSVIALSVVGGVELIFLIRHGVEMFQHTSLTVAEIHIVSDMRT